MIDIDVTTNSQAPSRQKLKRIANVPATVGTTGALAVSGGKSVASRLLGKGTAQPISKSAAVIKLLSRAKGTTVPELMAETGWQAHSVRAYFSGLRKKGHALVREQRKGGEQAYRIDRPAAAAASPVAATVPEAAEPLVGDAVQQTAIA